MNELIKIQDFNGNGQKAVSARELYEKLGLSDSQWSRWHKINILKNKFAMEGIDYQILRLNVEKGRPTMDFALTIDFAKKLSMMSSTEEGNKIRDYFILVEKEYIKTTIPQKPLSIAEMMLQSTQMLQLSAQLHIQHESKIKKLEEKHNTVEIKLLKLEEKQKANEQELFALPLSSETEKETSVKDTIRMLVNKYSAASMIPQKSVWKCIYSDLYYNYSISIRAYSKGKKESYLDVAERIGCLDMLHAIISEKIKTVIKNTELWKN